MEIGKVARMTRRQIPLSTKAQTSQLLSSAASSPISADDAAAAGMRKRKALTFTFPSIEHKLDTGSEARLRSTVPTAT